MTSRQGRPGSANLVGGVGVTLKNGPATTYQGMKCPGAPWGLKMACGENPKRVYGEKGGPPTRPGTLAGYRPAFLRTPAKNDKRAKAEGGDGQEAKRHNNTDTPEGGSHGHNHAHSHHSHPDAKASE